VVDAANPQATEQIQEVQRVLHEIGADRVPQIFVFNKIDALEPPQQPRLMVDELEREGGLRCPRVFLSAVTGQGLEALRDLIAHAAAAGAQAAPSRQPDPRFEPARSTDWSTFS
jgi:GTP-binding protein HflX